MGVHDIRGQFIGPETVQMGMHIEVPPGLSIEAADGIAQRVLETVRESEGCSHCVIQVEPSRAPSQHEDKAAA